MTGPARACTPYPPAGSSGPGNATGFGTGPASFLRCEDDALTRRAPLRRPLHIDQAGEPMNAVDHYRAAERDLATADRASLASGEAAYYIARAQVEATLALAGATFLTDKQHSYSEAHDQLANAVTGETL